MDRGNQGSMVVHSGNADSIGQFGAGDHRWWTHSSISVVCPVSGFPIKMLPYPPFKFRVDARNPKQLVLVDGKYIALKFLVDGALTIRGRPLDDSDSAALDGYIQRCKLGALRLKYALTLAEAIADPVTPDVQRSDFAEELRGLCDTARRELAALQRIQDCRLHQLKNRMIRSVGAGQANAADLCELQAAEKIIAERAVARENPLHQVPEAQAPREQEMQQERHMHSSTNSGYVVTRQQNGGQRGVPERFGNGESVGRTAVVAGGGGGVGYAVIAAEGVDKADCIGTGGLSAQNDLVQLMQQIQERYYDNPCTNDERELVAEGPPGLRGPQDSQAKGGGPLRFEEFAPSSYNPRHRIRSRLRADPSDELVKCVGPEFPSPQPPVSSGNAEGCDSWAPYLSPTGSYSFSGPTFPEDDALLETDCWADSKFCSGGMSIGRGFNAGSGVFSEGGYVRNATSRHQHCYPANAEHSGKVRLWDDGGRRSPGSETTNSSFNMGMTSTSSFSTWSRQISEPIISPSRRLMLDASWEAGVGDTPNDGWLRQVSGDPSEYRSSFASMLRL